MSSGIRELTDGSPERTRQLLNGLRDQGRTLPAFAIRSLTLDDAFLAPGACSGSRPRRAPTCRRPARSRSGHARLMVEDGTRGQAGRRGLGRLDQYTGIRSRTARVVSMIFLAAGIASLRSASSAIGLSMSGYSVVLRRRRIQSNGARIGPRGGCNCARTA